jgi:hypothetical protein
MFQNKVEDFALGGRQIFRFFSDDLVDLDHGTTPDIAEEPAY